LERQTKRKQQIETHLGAATAWLFSEEVAEVAQNAARNVPENASMCQSLLLRSVWQQESTGSLWLWVFGASLDGVSLSPSREEGRKLQASLLAHAVQ
jgi:hypothetical protein